MEDLLMAICSLNKDTESDAIAITIERNATKFGEIVDAICEKWDQLSSTNLIAKYTVPDQSMGACLLTLENDRDVVNMYNLHKIFNAPIVRISVMVKESTAAEPRADIMSRSAKLDMICENCRKHAEHVHWDHMELNNMSFFMAMTGDFACGLNLPEKFVNQFGGELSKNIYLKKPNGDKWRVELAKERNIAMMKSGWKEFVEVNNIEEDDVIFFKYSGRSCFDIIICDKTCCEKTTSCYAKDRASRKRERSTVDLKNRNRNSRGKAIRFTSSSSSADSLEDISSSPPPISTEDDEKAVNKDPWWSSSRTKHARSTSSSRYPKCRITKNRAIKGSEQRADEECLENHSSKARTLTHHHQKMTDEQHKRALKLVDAVHSAKPCFLIAVRPNMLQRSFVFVPVRFRERYLPSQPCHVFLQVPGSRKKWTVNYVAYMSFSWAGFRSGWKAFASDNNLQVGDICLFEMMTTHEDAVITVHISRVAE